MPRLAFRPLTVLAILALIAVVVGAQAPNPTPVDETAPRRSSSCWSRATWPSRRSTTRSPTSGARISSRISTPRKYYFEKADVDEFMAQATTLDDKIKEGNLDFARLVFERFLKRTDERLATVLELLKQKPDFTVDESIVDDPDLIDYPANAAEAKERWRKRIKFDLLQLKLDKTEGDEAIKKLTIRYRDRNRLFHQFDMSDLLEVYLSSLTRTFDPHSSYMSAKTLEDMIGQQLHLSLEGIGASLQSEDGYRGRQGDRPGHGRRQGRPAPARRQDRRHPEGERRGDRPGREEAQRRRPLHPRAQRHQGPADRPARRHQGAEDLRADPAEDRAHRAARQGADHRDQGRERQGAQDRRDQPAGLLRRHRGRPAGRPQRRQRHRGLPQAAQRVQGEEASTPS